MPEPRRARASAGLGRSCCIAGATSARGLAAARALLAPGARVVAVGSDEAASSTRSQPRCRASSRETCDLTDERRRCATLAERVHDAVGAVDGVLHLVGGWRGGGGLAGQTEEDYRFLERSFTALRHVSRAFDDDLRASPAGRLAIVSSTAVEPPAAGGANYAAVKAASEAWTRAVAQGFAKAESPAAAVTFRVNSLAGLEDRLAASVVDLWRTDDPGLNGSVIELRP